MSYGRIVLVIWEDRFTKTAPYGAAPPQQVVYQTAPPAGTGVPDDTVAQLERLGKLNQEGILTNEEFAAQKAKLLGG